MSETTGESLSSSMRTVDGKPLEVEQSVAMESEALKNCLDNLDGLKKNMARYLSMKHPHDMFVESVFDNTKHMTGEEVRENLDIVNKRRT